MSIKYTDRILVDSVEIDVVNVSSEALTRPVSHTFRVDLRFAAEMSLTKGEFVTADDQGSLGLLREAFREAIELDLYGELLSSTETVKGTCVFNSYVNHDALMVLAQQPASNVATFAVSVHLAFTAKKTRDLPSLLVVKEQYGLTLPRIEATSKRLIEAWTTRVAALDKSRAAAEGRDHILCVMSLVANEIQKVAEDVTDYTVRRAALDQEAEETAHHLLKRWAAGDNELIPDVQATPALRQFLGEQMKDVKINIRNMFGHEPRLMALREEICAVEEDKILAAVAPEKPE